MNKVVKILMDRDGIDREKAEALVRETRDEIISSIISGNSLFEIDQIIADYLGLEPDYIEDILQF